MVFLNKNYFSIFHESAEDLIVDNEPIELENEVIDAICPEAITSKVRCAAHTLNLAIEEGLKIQSIRGALARARTVINLKYLTSDCLILIN